MNSRDYRETVWDSEREKEKEKKRESEEKVERKFFVLKNDYLA